jgi:hypothetical protein
MSPLTPTAALDLYYLDIRGSLLGLAAALDRINHGGVVAADARDRLIARALDALADGRDNRAERVQLVFSLQYDPSWRRPESAEAEGAGNGVH